MHEALFETMPVGVVYQAADGRITDANPAAERILGLTLDQLQGRTSVDPRWRAVHEDGTDFPGEEHPAMAALRTGRRVSGVVMGVFNPATDELRWIRVDATPVLSPGESAPRQVYTTFLDITEQRAAETALRESEDLYRAAVERASDAIVIGRDERVVFANAAFSRMAGREGEDLRGFELASLIREEERAEIAERARRRVAGAEEPDLYELELLRPDGAQQTVEVRAGRIEYDGAPAILAVMRDVTERRRLEHELEDERLRYKLLMENSLDAVLLTRPDGAVLAANPAACRMFGRSEVEIVTVGRAGIVDSTDPRLAAGLAERARTGHFSGELRLLRADGTTFPGEVSSSVYTDHRGELMTSMVIRDVTEQRRSEREIRRLNEELAGRVASRTEQLDATAHELEALSYSVAHDLRAPLRAIDGFSAALIEDEAGRLSPRGLDELARVRQAAQTLARLLDDLTGLSRVSRRELTREPVDLTALARDVAAELAAAKPTHHVEVTVQEGLAAHADAALTRLILRELLENAWKFSAPRDPAHVEVGAVDTGGEPVFFVRDDGVGFDMEYAAHLFGAFQRMHPVGEFGGDGIGLALVRRLVRRHGGRVWAEARPGEGATFSFTLPEPAAEAAEE